jgi:phospholipid/cholesterol/gamma-HCH transport system permease protein
MWSGAWPRTIPRNPSPLAFGCDRPKKILLLRQLEISRLGEATSCVHLGGVWRLQDGLPTDDELERDVQAAAATRHVRFETQKLAGWDSSLVTFLSFFIDGCRRRGAEVDRSGLPEGVRRLLALTEAVPEQPARAVPHPSLLARMGNATSTTWQSNVRALAFLGEATQSYGRLLVARARHRRGDLYREIQKAGAQALPIVTLISLLLGMIMAFVGGVTLRGFGATLYTADVVAIAMVRELGAVMTAIIMAGRTGSAYAAELGTMRVSQEIDALVTMGIPPVDFLVLNRLLALSLMMPLLCVYADFVGIVGGGLVAVKLLGITVAQYKEEIRHSITLTTFAIGIGKSAVFGILVAMCGCVAGLRAGRSAAAVGDAATRAVVSAIVWIIVTDGIFAVVLYVLGV